MEFPDDLPTDRLERAIALQDLLISRATGGDGDAATYSELRREFMEDSATKPLLPRYVRTSRDLATFWPVAKGMSPHWEGRRIRIREDFEPLLDHLESVGVSPSDEGASVVLSSFSADGVAAVWQKARDRRLDDPEGAITLARTLLETVCKTLLDENEIVYSDKDDLPRLYRLTGELLNLAPDQHTEEAFRRILGGCTSIVEGLGTLRNKISDAHGHGRRKVRPQARHAQLAVSLSGAMATFLVETWAARQQGLRG